MFKARKRSAEKETRLHRVCQRHRGPRRGRGGDELIRAVRKARLEVELECERSGLHEPGAVLQLITQKELHAFLVSTTRGRHAAGMQGVQDLAGLVRVGPHRRSLTPSAVRTLQLEHAVTLS